MNAVYSSSFPYSYLPEIFPLSIRAKGTSIGASSNWMNNFIIAFIVPPMIQGIHWGMYLFFAVWLAIGSLFVWFFVPETKNKTLEEMDVVFGSVTAHADKELLKAAREEVGLEQMLLQLGSSENNPTTVTVHAEDKPSSAGHINIV